MTGGQTAAEMLDAYLAARLSAWDRLNTAPEPSERDRARKLYEALCDIPPSVTGEAQRDLEVAERRLADAFAKAEAAEAHYCQVGTSDALEAAEQAAEAYSKAEALWGEAKRAVG